MLIEILLVVLIIGLIFAGPSFDNILVTIAFYGGIIGGLILAWWYGRHLSGSLADFLLGGSGSGRAKESYSLAEKFEAEENFPAAIELYERSIDHDRKNHIPRLRLADLYFKMHDYDNCLECMQQALEISKDMSGNERCILMNRIADIYLQHKQDPASSLKILNRLIREFPNTRYAFYASDRIARIKENG